MKVVRIDCHDTWRLKKIEEVVKRQKQIYIKLISDKLPSLEGTAKGQIYLDQLSSEYAEDMVADQSKIILIR